MFIKPSTALESLTSTLSNSSPIRDKLVVTSLILLSTIDIASDLKLLKASSALEKPKDSAIYPYVHIAVPVLVKSHNAPPPTPTPTVTVPP